MNIENMLDLLTDYIEVKYDLTEEQAKDIVRFSLGTHFIVRAMEDKVGRLIDAGYFSGKRIPDCER